MLSTLSVEDVRRATRAATVAVAATLAVAPVATRDARALVAVAEVPPLRITAQNFNVFSSGTLRFVFAVDNARLRARLVAPDPAQPNELRVTLGEIKTTLHHLNLLREGELLFFKKDDCSLMTANEVPAFHVNVGTRGSQVAVQIDHEHVHGKP